MDECTNEKMVRKMKVDMCARCDMKLDPKEDHIIECHGGCKDRYHLDCLRNDVRENIAVLQQINNAVFFCDTCLVLYENGHGIGDIASTVKLLVNEIAKVKCSVDLLANFEEKIKLIVRDEIKSVVSVNVDQSAESNVQLKKRKRADGEITESDKTESHTSFATVLKNGSANSSVADKGNRPLKIQKITNQLVKQNEKKDNNQKISNVLKMEETVCVKPIQNQPMDETRRALKSAFNPVKTGVKSARYVDVSGEVFIRCQSKEKALELVKTAKETLGDKYTIEIKKPNRPKLKIVGHEEEDDGPRFIEELIEQNNLNENAEIKILKTIKNEKWTNNPMITILEVDAVTFETLIKKGKANVGWDRCNVYEAVNVLRCFKCWKFGHKANDCKETKCCPRCSENHEVKECEATEEKCINCVNFNKNAKDGGKVDEAHAAWSYECAIFKSKQNNARQYIDYTK